MNSLIKQQNNLFNKMLDRFEPFQLKGFKTELDWPFGTLNTKSVSYSTYEDENNQVIEMTIPGYAKKDIDIDITDNILTIKSNTENEVSHLVSKEFSKSFTLFNEAMVDDIKAELKDGLLKVVIPLHQPDVISKKVKIS